MPALSSAQIEGLMIAIAQRRSLGIARLDDREVDREILEQALIAADWAPSNGDTEPWRFQVYTGAARERLGEIFATAYREEAETAGTFKQETFDAQRERPLGAPVWIAIGMEPGRLPDGTLKMPIEDELMAVASAEQNLHLVLSAHGLVGMWHSKGMSVHPAVGRAIGFEEPARLLGFFFVGYPKVEWPEGERRPLEEKAKWIE
jgi:nitroreductase